MVKMKLINMYIYIYIYIGANNGSENYEQKKNTATFGKLIEAVYASYVYVYIFCTSQLGRLEYNFLFVGLREVGYEGGWV